MRGECDPKNYSLLVSHYSLHLQQWKRGINTKIYMYSLQTSLVYGIGLMILSYRSVLFISVGYFIVKFYNFRNILWWAHSTISFSWLQCANLTNSFNLPCYFFQYSEYIPAYHETLFRCTCMITDASKMKVDGWWNAVLCRFKHLKFEYPIIAPASEVNYCSTDWFANDVDPPPPLTFDFFQRGRSAETVTISF